MYSPSSPSSFHLIIFSSSPKCLHCLHPVPFTWLFFLLLLSVFTVFTDFLALDIFPCSWFPGLVFTPLFLRFVLVVEALGAPHYFYCGCRKLWPARRGVLSLQQSLFSLSCIFTVAAISCGLLDVGCFRSNNASFLSVVFLLWLP